MREEVSFRKVKLANYELSFIGLMDVLGEIVSMS